jgi:hypothetical protein
MCFSDDSRVIEGLVKIKPAQQKIKKNRKPPKTPKTPKQKIKKNRKPVSEQTKQKISKSMKGIKTNSQKTRQLISNSLKNLIRDTIHILNNKNEIIYICDTSFVEFCKNNNLPYQSFKSSYRKNGSPILLTNQSKSQLKEISHLMYEGWCAKKI